MMTKMIRKLTVIKTANEITSEQCVKLDEEG